MIETPLTLDEAAGLLRVSLSTLRDWHKHEGFPIMRLGHRTARVDPGQLREWLDARTVTAWPAEDGRKARSTVTGTDGASPSASDQTPSASASARNGNADRKRPPNASSRKSRPGSVVDFRQKKAASQ